MLYAGLKGIESINLLNYLPYNKQEVKEIIKTELSWRDYGGKHYESVFTRFYQGYILPIKFGIDKRKAHLSNLIFSGQLTKAEAIQELQKPMIEESQLILDYEFVIKKFNLTDEEFDALMKKPRKEHTDYKTIQTIYHKFPALVVFKPFIILLRKIGMKI